MSSAVDQHIVVIGAGLAGLRTVEHLRRRGHTGPITLLGSEIHAPYDRPPLSKAMLTGDGSPVALRKPESFAELDLTLRLGTTATGIDTGSHKISLDDGTTLGYDVLVIATGATPRTLPGAERVSGVHVLRTLDDARRLRSDLDTARSLVVVGGGFVGSEAAASARTLGRDVTIVEALEAPLVRVLGSKVASIVTGIHEQAGVVVRGGVGVAAVEPDGDGRIRAVRLADGVEVAADAALIGLGVTAATEWLTGSGLEIANGIRCDAYGRTSAADVFAVGDCSSWLRPSTGTHIRIEHWTNATEQAGVVARNILAESEDALVAHESVPYFWSDLYDIKIQSLGFPDPDAEVTVLPVNDVGGLAVYGRDGVAVAVVGFSAARLLMGLRPLLARGAPYDEVLAAAAG